MLYMVVERFKAGTAPEIYRRVREQGRRIPEGLEYVSSWVDLEFTTCYQLMRTDDASLFAVWTQASAGPDRVRYCAGADVCGGGSGDGGFIGETSQQRAKTMPHFSCIDGESTPWRASTFAPEVEVKDLGDANGRAMQLVRFPPGTVFPVHQHAGPEFVYILEGELRRWQAARPGWASVSAAGTVDDDVRSATGCVFLLFYSE